MPEIGSLIVDMALKSAEFIRELDKTAKRVEQSQARMTSSVKTLEKAFSAFLTAKVIKKLIDFTEESLKLAATMHGPLADGANKFLLQFEELQDSFQVGLASSFLKEINNDLLSTEDNLVSATEAGQRMGVVLGVTAKSLIFVFGTVIPDLASLADKAAQAALDKLDRLRGQMQDLSFEGMQTRLDIGDEETDAILAYGSALELARLEQESFWSATVTTTAAGEAFLNQTNAETKVLNDAAGPLEQYRLALERIESQHLTGEAAAIAHQQATANLAGNYLMLADNAATALGILFKDSKGVAIAQAVINTAQAITKTFAEYGATPWGFALAASMAAIGAAQIAAIATAQPGSSKATKKPSGAGASSATTRAGSASRGGSFSQAVTINIVGDVFGPEHFRKIAAGLNDVQRDGTALLEGGVMGTLRAEFNLSLGNLPIICWRNLVTATNVDAESNADFPASNVANPSTALKWKLDTTDSPVNTIEYFRVDISQADPISYVAIAGHNFSSQGIAVGLELASFGSPIGDAESAFEPQVPADDGPVVFLFTEREVEEIRIILIPAGNAAEMAVVRAGTYTQLEEGIQADHTPLPLAVVSDVTSGKSENGAFLGRIVIREGLSSSATIANMEEDFVMDEVIDFLAYASEFPFFWLWSPTTYPEHTAFAWLENDPQPTLDIDGYWAVDLSMRGLGA